MKSSEIEGKKLSEIDVDRLVTICHFVQDAPVPQNPAVHFQVCIRKEKVSQSGRFIRFDQMGDEVTGWQRMDYILLDEVLGELAEDGKTVNVLPREAEVIPIESAA